MFLRPDWLGQPDQRYLFSTAFARSSAELSPRRGAAPRGAATCEAHTVGHGCPTLMFAPS